MAHGYLSGLELRWRPTPMRVGKTGGGRRSGAFVKLALLFLALATFVNPQAPAIYAATDETDVHTAAAPAPMPTPAYEVSVNGKPLGLVADADAVGRYVSAYEAALSAQYGRTISLSLNVEAEPILATDAAISLPEAVGEAAVRMSDPLASAMGIFVDGALCAVVAGEEEAEAVKALAIEPFTAMAASRGITDVRFVEDVQVRPVHAPPGDVLDVQKAHDVLVRGGIPSEEYTVVQGDTIIGIAERFGLSRDELRYANPSLMGSDLIRVGDALNVSKLGGSLHITFSETVTREEAIPFSTTVKESSKYKKGTTQVEKAGKDGKREVVRTVSYTAGRVTASVLLSENVTSKPVDEVLVKGTSTSSSASSGTSRSTSGFKWPVDGSISSKFGARWNRQHKGIDIAASTGTSIYASKAGKVIFSGTKSGYGKVVYIDHGGGVITRYAHCSKLLVSKGDSVKQGAKIALVGSTGNSTGPHLHFEIRIDDEAINPLTKLP